MRSQGIDPAMRAAIADALGDGPWVEGGWDPPGDAIAERLVATLRASLEALSPEVAVAAAWSAAQGEAPMHPSASVEAWSRVALVWSSRELARASIAGAVASAEQASALASLATRIAQAAEGIGASAAEPPAAARTWRLDRVVAIARAQLSEVRDEGALEDVPVDVLGAFFDQLKHTFSLLASTDRPVDALVRAAVVRADRAMRRRPADAWAAAPRRWRVAVARQALLETAAALALAVPDEHGPEAERREACAWLARTACRIAACAARVDEWLAEAEPDDPTTTTNEATRERTNEAKSPTQGEESAVSNNTSSTNHVNQASILKTLEHDATDAAWRTAGSQFVKLAREPLVALLSRHLAPDDASFRGRVATFLDTEIGTAILASLLSAGLSALPAHAGQVPQRLARELRVRAMSDAGDLLAEILTGPLRQVMALYIQDPGGAPALAAEPPAALSASTPRVATNVVAMSAEREAVG